MNVAPELFEALDKNGKPTGQRKTKLQIIEDGDWRDVVHVWIVDSQNNMIAQQRAYKGLWDGLWDVSLGGGIASGESPSSAGVRELEE